VDFNADVIVSLHVGSNSIDMGGVVNVLVELEADTVDLAVSLFKVFYELKNSICFLAPKHINSCMIVIIVKQFGVGISLVSPFEGFADEIVDLVPDTVSNFLGLVINGLINDIPGNCFARISAQNFMDVGFKEAFNLHGVRLISNKGWLISLLARVSPDCDMASKLHFVVFSKF
jgi:hypothetical protein